MSLLNVFALQPFPPEICVSIKVQLTSRVPCYGNDPLGLPPNVGSSNVGLPESQNMLVNVFLERFFSVGFISILNVFLERFFFFFL